MSYQLLAIIAIILFVSNIILNVMVWKRSKKISELRNGQTQWREIAFHHEKEAKGWRKEYDKIHAERGTQDIKIETYQIWFRHLAVVLWGNPPLESRTMKDALNFIQDICRTAGRQAEIAHGLQRICQQQDNELKRERECAGKTKHELHCFQTLVAHLVENKWTLTESRDEGKPIRFDVFRFDSEHVADGSTMGEAIENALMAKRRADEELSS